MQCPVDGTELLMTDRNGVEIDYCPQCRGIWLDRGELDKIVERSIGGGRGQDAPRSRDDGDRRKRKKNDWFDLGDLFDF